MNYFYTVMFVVIMMAAWSSSCAQAQCEIDVLMGQGANGVENYAGSIAIGDGFIASGTLGTTEDDEGSVHVYRLVEGNWVVQTILSDGTIGCGGNTFSERMVANDKVLVIPDERETVFACSGGTVYIYRFLNGVPTLEQVIGDPEKDEFDRFGNALSIQSDLLAVGMTGFFRGTPGAAYVYRYDGEAWNQEAMFIQPEGENGQTFAWDVAVAQDVFLIGDYTADGPSTNTGAAYVYREKNGAWSFDQKLVPSDAMQFTGQQFFGRRLVLDAAGDTAAIGANHTLPDGAVYIYDYDGSTWVETAKLEPENPQGQLPRFGGSVAISDNGNTVMISSSGDTEVGYEGGAVYVFRRVEGKWDQVLKFIKPGSACLGLVAIEGDLGLIGDPCGSTGEVYVLAGLEPTDCNNNSTPDGCDIATGTSLDTDGDGVPDECDIQTDLNLDGAIDGSDLGILLGDWGQCRDLPCPPDINNDGVVDGSDLGLLLGDWTVLPEPNCSGEGDCCTAHDSPGCDDAGCCEMICESDPFCCESAWDAICVNAAQEFCGCSPPPGCDDPEAGGCCLPGPSGNGSPGCDDAACCETVCDYIDPFCCDVQWDDACAAWAFQYCDCPPIVCSPDNEPCCEFDTLHGPGCSDPECCILICELDSYCCNVVWDFICVQEANKFCEVCGGTPPDR